MPFDTVISLLKSKETEGKRKVVSITMVFIRLLIILETWNNVNIQKYINSSTIVYLLVFSIQSLKNQVQKYFTFENALNVILAEKHTHTPSNNIM